MTASGQRTTYGAITRAGGTEPSPVADDGAVRAGAPLAYVDNGDGTMSDVNTGLVWEKKCDGCGGLHDVKALYRWDTENGETDVPAWLETVNAEEGAGFAGHRDWRLPTVAELMTIVDYERFNPAVGASFDGPGCGLDCDSPAKKCCSCTRLDRYWTATRSRQHGRRRRRWPS